jgi:hypothetical protein
MLDGVNLSSVHHRLVIWFGKTQVKGCHRLTANLVLPGYIEARLQFDMINGKTGDFFHKHLLILLYADAFLLYLYHNTVHLDLQEKQHPETKRDRQATVTSHYVNF